MFYTVQIPSVSVGDKKLTHVNWRPIVDSGTSFSFVKNQVYIKLKSEFFAQCSSDKYTCDNIAGPNPPGTNSEDKRLSIGCWKLSQAGETDAEALENMRSFPPIEFHMKGLTSSEEVHVCVVPEQYFFLSDNGIHCVGINPLG